MKDTKDLTLVAFAGFWRRFGALLVDLAVLGLLYLGWSMIPAIPNLVNIFICNVFYTLYFAFFESSKLQATPGKLVFKIRVTDCETNRIKFVRALARNLGQYVSIPTLGIGYVMVFFTKRKQCLHDIIANCLVVRNRTLLNEQSG